MVAYNNEKDSNNDSEGEPFVGRSGKLLDQLLLSVGINPEKDVFICNAVKCRPPKNRRPTKAELKCSLPWLYQQVHLVDPWVIVLAGSTAVEAILGMKHTMSTIRGSWQLWKQRLIMPIFHPSYLLRNPSKDFGKPFSLTRADLIDVRNKLETIKSQVPIPPISGIENLKS